jgi:hypothetical protein
MFPKVSKNPDRFVLIKMCEDAKEVGDIFKNLPEAIKENFNVDIISLQYSVEYKKEVSNSHSCPINGVENFMRDNSKPLYYKGLQGRIEFTVINHQHIRSCSSMFGNRGAHSVAGVNLGSGGGSSVKYMKDGELYMAMNYSFDVKVFIDDFDFLNSAVDAHFISMEVEADRLERLHKLKHPNYYYYRKPIKLTYEGSFEDDKYNKVKEQNSWA